MIGPALNVAIHLAAVLQARASAMNESNWSNLPGRQEGPADAYRHVLFAGELTRQLGEYKARAILEARELQGRYLGNQSDASEAMDRYNNELGIEIGRIARQNGGSWEQVVSDARKRIDPQFVGQSDGTHRCATWLPENEWWSHPTEQINWDPTSGPTWPARPYPAPGQMPNGMPSGSMRENGCKQIGAAAADVNDSKARTSPLVLDLDGDGVETTNQEEEPAYFDHDANGFAERTGWVSPDDGLLVWDRNQNGWIDDGRELFGNESLQDSGSLAANGFSALQELDTNANGKIDSGDGQFALLRVWCDLDADGWSKSSELYTLNDLGIQSIDTSSSLSSYVDPQGNAHKQVGSFTRIDGSTGQVADVWFKTDLGDTLSVAPVEIPAGFSDLPYLSGFGNIPDLWDAMATDETGQLQALVEQFATEQDPTVRHQIVRNMLSVWTDASQIDLNSRGSYVDGQTMRIVESFTGSSFQGRNGADPTKFEGPSLLRAYSSIHELAYGQLMAQTHFEENLSTYTSVNEVERPISDIEFLAEAYERFKLTGEIDPKLFQKFSGHLKPGAPAPESEMQLENLMLEMALSLTATGLGEGVSDLSHTPHPFPGVTRGSYLTLPRAAEEMR